MGLIEIFQRPDSAPNIQKGYLRFLDQMAGLIGEWLKGHTLKQVSDRQQLWQQADHFAPWCTTILNCAIRPTPSPMKAVKLLSAIA